MTKRRYRYSYSPSTRREGVRRVQPRRTRGWLLLTLVLVLVAGAVAAQKGLRGGGDGGAAVAHSNCWTQVACSAEEIQQARASSQPEEPETNDGEPEVSADEPDESGSQAPPPISAAAAAVIEEPCGAVIHGFNTHGRLPPASVTKIMTALVAAQQSDIRQTVDVTVDGGALSEATDATVMGLSPGQQLSLTDLLYGLLLPSGNDAAIQIAEQVAGSVDDFVGLMNDKVDEMDLGNTHFANPHGLDEPGHYTSAYDIALIGRQLLKDPDLAFIVSTRSYQPAWDGPPVANLNLLLGNYPGALGVKTGYTPQAGQTIVAAAQRDGRRFIVSVLGSADNFADATALLDWAFGGTDSSCDTAGGSQVAANP
jgi:serine-type D-Ala-D-Ala carboxypeptidase (penicillin-binding protein 5/6)